MRLCVVWLLGALATTCIAQNQNPTFTPGSDVTVTQDSGTHNIAWATNISDGDAGTQALTFTATPANSALFASGVTVSSTGVLTFRPASGRSGSTLVTVFLRDDGAATCPGCPIACNPSDCAQSTTVQFTLNVVEVNQCPSFTKGSDQTALENSAVAVVNSWAKNVKAGPASESSQTVTFSVTNDNTELFQIQPSIDYTQGSSNADLRFKPAQDKFGVARVFITLKDSAGTGNGGCDTFTSSAFTITVTETNDPPTFSMGPTPITVNENHGPYTYSLWATKISPGGASETQQTVAFVLALVDNAHAALFKVAPQIDTGGTLQFEANENRNTKDITVLVTVQLTDSAGGESCATAACPRLQIVITPKNSPPFFQPGNDLTVWEDRKDSQPATFNWATAITPGNTFEVAEGQTIRFVVANTAPELFTVAPSIDTSGVLSFTLAQYKNGAATVTVTIYDSETENNMGNVASFRLNVLSVNNAPQFAFVPTQPHAVNQNSGALVISDFLRSIGPAPDGADDEKDQRVTLSVAGSPATMFKTAPALSWTSSSTARVEMEIADNVFGTATLTITALDDGGTARTGVNQRTQTFAINVIQLNAAPTFAVPSGDITNLENQFPLGNTMQNFVTEVSSGPFEPSSGAGAQSVTLSITATSTHLFSVQPALDSSGTLTYTVRPNEFGTSTLTVTATDNGSPPLSTAKQVKLYILAVNHQPAFTPGPDLVNGTLTECRSSPSCAYAFPQWATAISAGPANENTQTLNFVVSEGNAAYLFGELPKVSPSTGSLTFSLKPYVSTQSNGALELLVKLTDSGGTENGGVDSKQVSVAITVDRYAGEPTLVHMSTVTLRRNSALHSVPNFATNIAGGTSGSTTQQLVFDATALDPAMFDAGPTVAPSGTSSAIFSARPAPHVYGRTSVTLRVTNTDTGKSALFDFEVDITFVNQAPSFDVVPSVTVPQGGHNLAVQVATNISVGINEASQLFSFALSCSSTTGARLFSNNPIIDALGILRLSTETHATGTAECTATMRDTGGVSNGGADTSTARHFTVTVVRVNHAPAFSVATSRVSMLENGPVLRVGGWARDISAGAGDEALGQQLTFHVACASNSVLVSVPSVDSASGDLVVEARPNTYGEVACSVTLHDSGAGDPPNVNSSTATSLEIAVLHVNQPPTFLIANRTISVVARAQRFEFGALLTAVSPGPPNEAAQTTRVVVTTVLGEHNFAGQPELRADGTLVFTTAMSSGLPSGVAKTSICVIDSGGTANGGRDTTCESITVSVTRVPLDPSFDVSNVTVTQLQRAGLVQIPQFLASLDLQSDESLATITTSVAPANCATAFEVHPRLDRVSGVFTFAAATWFAGSCTVNITLSDGNGLTTSRLVDIEVLPVNLQPSFVAGANLTIVFREGMFDLPWGSAFSAGDAGETSSQTLAAHAVVRTSGVFASPVTFNVTTGNLQFSLAQNERREALVDVFVTDDGGRANGGSDTSSVVSVLVSIMPRNTAPSFAASSYLRVLETTRDVAVSGWASEYSLGDAAWEDVEQLGRYAVTTNASGAFSQLPRVSWPAGDLTFVLQPGFVHQISIEVTLLDNGGVVSGGIDRSPAHVLTVDVIDVNDAPSFALSQRVVYAVQGQQTVIRGWCQSVTAGSASEASQSLSFTVLPSDGSTFSSVFDVISVSADNLTVVPHRFFSGRVSITVTLRDNGGTRDGGVDLYSVAAVIEVLSRNSPPVFSVMPSVEVTADLRPMSVPNFVTALSAVEVSQLVTMTVATDSPQFFRVLPQVDSNGTMTFTLASADVAGVAMLTVAARDDGGTANGGNDTAVSLSMLSIIAPARAPTFDLVTTLLTVATSSSLVLPVATAVVSNARSSTSVTFSVTVSDTTLVAATPALAADGVLTAATSALTGTTSLTIVARNADGAASVPAVVALRVVTPKRIALTTANDATTFDVAQFRQQVAVLFAVTPAQVIVVSVTPASVRVVFYIAGEQPTMTAEAFVLRATQPDDPIHTTLAVSNATIVTAVQPTPLPVPTTQPATASPSSAPSSSDFLGVSTTVWIVVVVIVCILVVAIVLVACCTASRRRTDEPAKVVPETTPPRLKTPRQAPQHHMFPQRASTPSRRQEYVVNDAYVDEYDDDVFIDVDEFSDEEPENLYPVRAEARAPPQRTTRGPSWMEYGHQEHRSW